MRSIRLAAAAAIAIIAILALTYVMHDDDSGSLVILHSNDTHCYYDDGLGLSTLGALKDSMESEGNTVFTVDAGDFLQGAPFGTITQGKASVDVMNSVGYDVGVPGNHEFDFGFPVLLERAASLNYPLICANLIYPDGSSVFSECVLLEKSGMKVGFFGLLTPDSMSTVKAGSMGEAIVTDPVEAASRMVPLLRGMGADKVIAIGHIGVEGVTVTSDEICDRVRGIDLFIDGHSHTAMEGGKAEGIDLIPTDTVIASTGGHCTSFGIVRMDGGKTEASLYAGEPLRDEQVDEAVRKVREECSAVLETSIATSETFLNGERNDIRSKETSMGDLVADAMRWYGRSYVAAINSGTIRSSIQAGEITLNDVYAVLPFQDDLVRMEVEGRSLYELMEGSYAHLGTGSGGLLQISGMTVTYDPAAEVGSRVVSIYVGGSEVVPDSIYSICATDYLAKGGDGIAALTGYAYTGVGDNAMALWMYLQELGTITESDVKMGRQTASFRSQIGNYISLPLCVRTSASIPYTSLIRSGVIISASP